MDVFDIKGYEKIFRSYGKICCLMFPSLKYHCTDSYVEIKYTIYKYTDIIATGLTDAYLVVRLKHDCYLYLPLEPWYQFQVVDGRMRKIVISN